MSYTSKKPVKYRAYVIYGGQFVYARSGWMDSYEEARKMGRGTCSPDERAFIGVVADNVSDDSYSAFILRAMCVVGNRGML